MTHFRPDEINITAADAVKLGYATDVNGDPVVLDDQVIEIYPQDIVVPSYVNLSAVTEGLTPLPEGGYAYELSFAGSIFGTGIPAGPCAVGRRALDHAVSASAVGIPPPLVDGEAGCGATTASRQRHIRGACTQALKTKGQIARP